MRLFKSAVALFSLFILPEGVVSQSVTQKRGIQDLYQGIEFKMPKVQEPVIPANSVLLTDFGAVSGGQDLCTKAFASAIDALSKRGGGRLVIPRGTWLTGPVTLKSNIELYTEAGALVFFFR